MIRSPRYCPQCGAALEMREDGGRVRPVCPACGFVFYLNAIVAAATLVEREGRVALVKRGVDPGRGLWGLPGGYVEADESAEEAAMRETWEEAHLRVELDGLLDAFSYRSAQNRGVLLIYAARVVEGELLAGDDAIDAQWFGADELPEVAFRTHREVLRQWRRAQAVTYRLATPAEAEVAAMLGKEHLFDAGCEQAAFVSDPSKRLFVAVDQGQVVGYAGLSLVSQNRTAQINHVFVHPRYRRWGVGTHLILACVHYCRSVQICAVMVEATVSDPSWTVYLKAGFRISGFSSSHYTSQSDKPQAALLLSCDLREPDQP
jgi:8-oxo-dGTP diphosphatase